MAVKLHQGDCMRVLLDMEAETVDSVVTDPPYGMAWETKGGEGVVNDERPFVWWLHHAFRVTRRGGALLCFCNWATAHHWRWAIELAGWSLRSQAIWDREMASQGHTGCTFAPKHDVVWFATKGRFRFPGGRPASVIRAKTPTNGVRGPRLHPTQKPLALMKQLVSAVTPARGMVLDPFMGSGATGVAAVACGMSFIGIELDAGHFETASRLVRGASGEAPSGPLGDGWLL